MFSYLARRMAWTLFSLLGVSILMFMLMHAIPGSPWNRTGGQAAMANVSMDDAAKRTLNQRFGLDLPIWRQYLRYMIGDFDADGQFDCGAICGHLGPSLSRLGRTVEEIIFVPPETGGFWDSRFMFSMRLAGLGLVLVVTLGLPLGVWLSRPHSRAVEAVGAVLLAILTAVPNFILGLVLVVGLAVQLHWVSVLPDWRDPLAWLMPAFVLAVAPMGMLARMTRTAMREVMNSEFVRTARAKGLRQRRIVWGHILKNAAIPIVAHLGPVLFDLIAASIVIESMFGFPGFGREYYEGIRSLDYSLVMGLTLLYTVFFMLANLISDLLYAALDARVRLGE